MVGAVAGSSVPALAVGTVGPTVTVPPVTGRRMGKPPTITPLTPTLPVVPGASSNVRLLPSGATLVTKPGVVPTRMPVFSSNAKFGSVVVSVMAEPPSGVAELNVAGNESTAGLTTGTEVWGLNVSVGAPSEVTSVIVSGELTLGGRMAVIVVPSGA